MSSILPESIHSFIISLLFSSRTTQKLLDYWLGTPSPFKKMGCVPNYLPVTVDGLAEKEIIIGVVEMPRYIQ